MVTRDPFQDKPKRLRPPSTPESRARVAAQRQARAEAEGYRNDYERRIARGLGRGETRTEARGHVTDLWKRAVADGPTRVSAEGIERDTRPRKNYPIGTQRWTAIRYTFHYPDGSTRDVVLRGRMISKQARRDRIQELQDNDIEYEAEYLDADLGAPPGVLVA